MTDVPTLSLAQRFAISLGGILRSVADRGGRDHSVVPMVVLVWTRLNRMGKRFALLVARFEAGTLKAPRPPSDRGRAERMRAAREAKPAEVAMPRGFGWLGQFSPATLQYGSQIQHLLGDAEMLALVAAAPQAGRVLRPLCRMLGYALPEALKLPPRRARKRKRVAAKTAPGGKLAGEGSVKRAGKNPGVGRASRFLGPSPGMAPGMARGGRAAGKRPRWVGS